MVSSPVIALGVLPVTGASRKWIPCFDSRSPIFVAKSTPIVDMSIIMLPGFIDAATPSIPKSISSTSSPAVTIVMRISTSFASQDLLSQTFAPIFFSPSVRSILRFHTESSHRFERIFFAIGSPMSPSQINPIFIKMIRRFSMVVLLFER